MIKAPDDFPLTNEQLAQLAGYGICFIHTHPKEDLGFVDRLALMQATPITVVTTTPYAPTRNDEILLVDTTAGNVTIELPIAARGREFQVIKIAGGNPVFVIPDAGEAIIGNTEGVTFSNVGSSIHLKAVTGVGYWLL